MMPLDFYIANLQRIAPQLSALYRELLQRGAVSQTMRHPLPFRVPLRGTQLRRALLTASSSSANQCK